METRQTRVYKTRSLSPSVSPNAICLKGKRNGNKEVTQTASSGGESKSTSRFVDGLCAIQVGGTEVTLGQDAAAGGGCAGQVVFDAGVGSCTRPGAAGGCGGRHYAPVVVGVGTGSED